MSAWSVCPLSLDELVDHWTLLDDERRLVAGKRGPTRLGFALLLKFYHDTDGSRLAVRSCLMKRYAVSSNS